MFGFKIVKKSQHDEDLRELNSFQKIVNMMNEDVHEIEYVIDIFKGFDKEQTEFKFDIVSTYIDILTKIFRIITSLQCTFSLYQDNKFASPVLELKHTEVFLEMVNLNKYIVEMIESMKTFISEQDDMCDFDNEVIHSACLLRKAYVSILAMIAGVANKHRVNIDYDVKRLECGSDIISDYYNNRKLHSIFEKKYKIMVEGTSDEFKKQVSEIKKQNGGIKK